MHVVCVVNRLELCICYNKLYCVSYFLSLSLFVSLFFSPSNPVSPSPFSLPPFLSPSLPPSLSLSPSLSTPFLSPSLSFSLSLPPSPSPPSLPPFLIQLYDIESQPLEISHWHFLGWPDHGCPQYATSLISFIRQVRKHYNKSGPPLLVHCSAGVGRTGTFILLDSMLERLSHEDNINVYEFLKNMRSKRVFMVQTLVGQHLTLIYVHVHVHCIICKIICCAL